MKRNISALCYQYAGFFGIAALTCLAACSDDDEGNQPVADNVAFNNLMLKGNYETPAVTTTATGTFTGTYERNSNMMTYTITFSGVTPTAMHFHKAVPGIAGGIEVPINGPYASPLTGSATLTDAQEADLLAGRWYVNIHSAANPSGEIRGQLVSEEVKFTSIALNGASEVPPVTTTATGLFTGTYNRSSKTMPYTLTFSGLTPTAAHFHKAPANESGPIEIPINGPFTSPMSATTSALTAAQEADLINGLWYVNMHTTANPGGEIRGQLITGQ